MCARGRDRDRDRDMEREGGREGAFCGFCPARFGPSRRLAWPRLRSGPPQPRKPPARRPIRVATLPTLRRPSTPARRTDWKLPDVAWSREPGGQGGRGSGGDSGPPGTTRGPGSDGSAGAGPPQVAVFRAGRARVMRRRPRRRWRPSRPGWPWRSRTAPAVKSGQDGQNSGQNRSDRLKWQS